jgi:hypothetical protein
MSSSLTYAGFVCTIRALSSRPCYAYPRGGDKEQDARSREL